MYTEPAFNAIAQTYDADFTESIIGKLQRNKVWYYLEKYLPQNKKLKILEINCGTGTDAIWLANKGHEVIATDISDKMIEWAQVKLKKEAIDTALAFEICSFENLKEKYKDQKFDILFSNFGGLNCSDQKALEQLNHDFKKLLNPDGKLIMVLLGKYCLMEQLYFFLKSDYSKIKRRMNPTESRLSENTFQPTWYYTAKDLQQIFNAFQLQTKKPIGLFIPPSFLEKQAIKHPKPIRVLSFFEKQLGNISSLSNFGDHILIVFEKK
ncbi:MAG: methyltransferase domain-containing protein [Bacteroidota bacterium]|nr:methyltransferase domain-containing protein [Bacteroidota bacterium]